MSLGLSIFPVFLKLLKSELEKTAPLVFHGNADRSENDSIFIALNTSQNATQPQPGEEGKGVTGGGMSGGVSTGDGGESVLGVDGKSGTGELTASLWSLEHNGEFHRVWSAMQFVMSRSQGKHELTVE